MVYVHPILGALTLSMVVWLGMLGLRARHRARYAPRARKLHRRLSTGVFATFLAVALLGAASAHWLREDLTLGGSRHFVSAMVGVGLMITLYALGRRLPGDRLARRLHPPLGLITLAVAIAMFVLGFSLLP